MIDIFNKNKINNAFTLAEVLITLGVIGVVSAVTMPTLIQNYQKQVTINRLKADYNLLVLALKRAEADYGPIQEWNINYQNVGNFTETYLLPYIKTVKKDYVTPKHKYLNGNKSDFGQEKENSKTYALANGSEIFIFGDNYWHVIFIALDINGAKNPNTFGKDTFYFQINKKFLIVPNGNTKTRERMISGENSGCNIAEGGNYCAALIMLDGWKISDDYPW